MYDFVSEMLRSNPAVVVYTVLVIVALMVGGWFTPIGKKLRETYDESRQMRQIALLRKFNEETAPIRHQEMSGLLGDKLGPVVASVSQIDGKLDQVLQHQAATDARLAEGSEQIRSLNTRMDAVEKSTTKNTADVTRVLGQMDILTRGK